MPWLPLDIEFVGTPFNGTLLCTGLDDVAHEELPEEVLVALADPSIAKVTFTTTDHRWLKLAGYEVGGDILDVQVMAWLLDEAQALDLESVAARYLTQSNRVSSVGCKAHGLPNVFGSASATGNASASSESAFVQQGVRGCGSETSTTKPGSASRHDQAVQQRPLPTDQTHRGPSKGALGLGATPYVDAGEEARSVSPGVGGGASHRRGWDEQRPEQSVGRPSERESLACTCEFELGPYRMDKRISTIGSRLVFKCDNGKVVDLIDAPRDELCAYNVRDLEATSALFLELWQRLDEAGMLNHFLEDQVPFTSVLVDMMCRGLPYDVEGGAALREELSSEMTKLDAELHESAGLPDAFNLNSGPQLSAYLFNKRFELKARVGVPPAVREVPKAERAAAMQLKVPRSFKVEKVGTTWAHGAYDLPGRGLKAHAKTKGGAPSTEGKKLRVHYGNDPWVKQYLELSTRTTAVSYLSQYEREAHTGRLYSTIKQTGTVTGRLSSSSPNVQNIPARTDLGRRIRGLFKLYGIHGDYSQLEPRLMAHWSQDLVLLDTFRNERDIYRVTAAYIFGVDYDEVTDEQRGPIKTLVLAMGYGAGAKKMSEILAEAGYPTTEATAAAYLRELKKLYRTFFSWKEDVIRGAGAVGYVQTLAGRRRRLVSGDKRGTDGDHWKNADLSEVQAANAVIQGSAGDIVQRVMVRSSEAFPDFGLIVQVHDELMWQSEREPSPFQLFKLQKIAEQGHGFKLSVPLRFEPKLVKSWADGK